MKDDFMYVLENYPNADLSNERDRDVVANALSNIMCEHHVVTYTNLDSVDTDPKMTNWINYCKSKNEENSKNQLELPFDEVS